MSFRIFLIVTLIILITGCSQNIDQLTPGNHINPSTSSEPPGLLVESLDNNANPLNGMGMIGIYHASINPDNLTGEIVPIRNVSLDDTLEIVDITNFLTLAPCGNCAKIASIKMDIDNNLVVRIGIKHPFDVGDPLKPISGRNRADLHVFNVEGTVLFDDSSSNTPFPAIGETLGPVFLTNADGYSPYLDIVLDDLFPTTATIHPYILHFDDYSQGNYNPSNPMGFESVTTPPPSGNLVMPMGSDYDVQDYVFGLSGDESFEFIYAIGCTYAVSAASKNERFTPEYQVPQHNKKAASEVSVEIVNNDLTAGNSTSTAELLIKVLDMNHGVLVGTALNEMKADSSVSQILIEILGVTSGAISGSTTPTGGDGRDPANPLTFPVTVSNNLAAGEGNYTGLVKVLDSYSPGSNESPLLNSMDGIKRVGPIENPLGGLYEIPEFATYATFEIEIEVGNEPPVASFCGTDIRICAGSRFYLDASSSYDLEDDLASIPLTYEFDFDYDGATFTVEAGPSNNPIALTQIYNPPGPYTAAVRVTDSGSLKDIETITITIGDQSFTPDAWISDVTDGSSIQNVRFFHTKDNVQVATRGRAYGTEGMAYGDCYVYLTFFTSGGDVYFTRSDDAGQTWDTPIPIVTGVANLQGCAITAVGKEVFIITAQTATSVVSLHKNSNSGEGAWTTYQVYDYTDGWSIHDFGVAVDPNNTDYINVALVRNEAFNGFSYSYHLRNDQGGAGTWTEQSLYYNPHIFNGRQIDIGCNSDGSFYVAYLANQYVGVTRSDDHGVTWTEYLSSNSVYTGAWSAELDMCFDPLNPDVIYIAWTSVGYQFGYHPSLRLAKSTNRANSFTVIQTQLEHQINLDDLPRQPAIICDMSGKLYVAYTFELQTAPGDFDIFMKASCNGGTSFSSETQLNLDDPGFDVDPELVLCPHGGVVLAWDENGYTAYDGGLNENPSGKIVARHIK